MKEVRLKKNKVVGIVEADYKSYIRDDADTHRRICHILRNMYSNTVWAVVREYIANALDVDIDKTILVTAPNKYIPVFKVRDYGPGMDKQSFIDNITGYGETDKIGDSSRIGGFGIGAKCGLAYTNSYTYANNYRGEDGKLMRVVIQTFLDDFLEPAHTTLYDGEWDEEDGTGVTVEVPVAKDDISRFVSCIYSFIYDDRIWNRIVLADGDNVLLGMLKNDYNFTHEYCNLPAYTSTKFKRSVTVAGKNVTVDMAFIDDEGNNIVVGGRPCNSGIVVIMNGVPYPVNKGDLVSACPNKIIGLNYLRGGMVEHINRVQKDVAIIITVDGNTDLEPVPSRETITMSPVGANFLVNCMDTYSKLLYDEYMRDPIGFINLTSSVSDVGSRYITAFLSLRSYPKSEENIIVDRLNKIRYEIVNADVGDNLTCISDDLSIDTRIPDEVAVFYRDRRIVDKAPYLQLRYKHGEYENNFKYIKHFPVYINSLTACFIYFDDIPKHIVERAERLFSRYLAKNEDGVTEFDELSRLYKYLLDDYNIKWLRGNYASMYYTSKSSILMQKVKFDKGTGKITPVPLKSYITKAALERYPEDVVYVPTWPPPNRGSGRGRVTTVRAVCDKPKDVPIEAVPALKTYYVLSNRGYYEPNDNYIYIDSYFNDNLDSRSRDTHISRISGSACRHYKNNILNAPGVLNALYFIENGHIVEDITPDMLRSMGVCPSVDTLTPAVFLDKVVLGSSKDMYPQFFRELDKAIEKYFKSRPKIVKEWLESACVTRDLTSYIAHNSASSLPVNTSDKSLLPFTALLFDIYYEGPIRSAIVDKVLFLMTTYESIKCIPDHIKHNRYFKNLTLTDIWLGNLLGLGNLDGLYISRERHNTVKPPLVLCSSTGSEPLNKALNKAIETGSTLIPAFALLKSTGSIRNILYKDCGEQLINQTMLNNIRRGK